jgi:integrase
MAIAFEKNHKLPYVQRQSRGKYLYFRHPTLKLSRGESRLPSPQDSPEFCAAYESLLARAERRKPEASRPDGRPVRVPFAPGTLGWLAAKYIASGEFLTKKAGTKYAYERMLHLMRESDGGIAHRLLKDINCEHIAHHCHQVQKEHGRARGDHQCLIISVLWRYARKAGLRECKLAGLTNPCRERERSYRSQARLAWPPDVQHRFVEGAPPHLKLTFLLSYYTAQRRGDIAKMKWTDFDGKRIMVTQEKSGKRVPVKVHRELLLVLNNMKRVSEYVLTRPSGAPYAKDKSALSKAVQRRLQQIGEPPGRFVLHGLRHAAGVRLAELGFGTKQIMAVLGHSSPAMSLHYQKQADESKMIDDVVSTWERAA